MKTIKQIADEIGVSKDKVKYQSRKLPSNYLCKKGNITYLTDDGILKIKDLLVGKTSEHLPGNYPVFTHHEENELYKILKAELEAKNKLIDEQQQTINKLMDRLAAAQQSEQAAQLLHGGTMYKQLKSGDEDAAGSITEPKKGFLKRLFGKK